MTQNFSERDKMNRQMVVDNIIDSIQNMPTKYDNSHDGKQIKNATIALNGEWGSGKSFVMNMLRERLEAEPHYIVVNYDAWKNNFYNDPLIAMLYCVIDDFYKKANAIDENKICKSFVEKAITGLKEKGKEWLEHIIEKGERGNKKLVKILCSTIAGIFNIVKETNKILLDNDKFADFRSYQTLLSEVTDLFNTFTQKSNKKLIILVDEIDRCLPNEQLLVLERLHHLFDVGNCAVIVAINKNAVIQTYEKQFCIPKDNENPLLAHIDGEIYLRKFFDRNIDLERGELVYIKAWLTKYFEENTPKGEVTIPNMADYIIPFMEQSFMKNNLHHNSAREVTRFVEQLAKVLEATKISYSDVDCFGEIWFVCVMTYYKLFEPAEYAKYKSGANQDRQSYLMLTELIEIENQKIVESTPYYVQNTDGSEKIRFTTYKDQKLTYLQYILNYSLFRNENPRIMFNYEQLTPIGVAGRCGNYGYPELLWVQDYFDIIDKYIV